MTGDEEDWRLGTVLEAGRADVVVARLAGVSRTRAAALIRGGAAWVDGRPLGRASEAVTVGGQLAVLLPEPESGTVDAQDLPLEIVFQDPSLVILDKAAGMVVHPGAGHSSGTLVNALLHHVRDLSGIGGVVRPGIVHRLDRGTSGLMVVAKTDAAHQALAAQFADKTAGRGYVAIARAPKSDAGVVDAPIGRHPTDRVRFAVVANGRAAVTHWEVASRSGPWALIRCRLETGRTHQVRVHLAHIGAPILGDPLYARGLSKPSAMPTLDDNRPLLHAWSLRLVHPETGRLMTFFAPAPTDFRVAAELLGLADGLPRAGG